eukprot:TRINITY_DN1024_c2_g1_i1.p1 TRINITY_DN1024_c2_g1~~TRINITY_DN1024_c2_g1_i1.p1  ORF type:complete len:352 (-),score=69.45 TRINITY_DN1024_c2_g1_i1:1124-2179(-)
MKAIGQQTFGSSPEVLKSMEVPIPNVGPRDVLVKIRAVGLNPVDCNRRTNYGNHNATLSGNLVLGFDAAGVVEKIGSEATRFNIGDEVYFMTWIPTDLSITGTFAEYHAIDERVVARKPANLTFEIAATIPLVTLTIWEALFEEMKIAVPQDGSPNPNANKSILIVGGGGGVGVVAIQLAKKFLKLNVIATASKPESVDVCKNFGADHVIDHTKDLFEEIKRIGVNSCDYILECYDLDKNLPVHLKIIKPIGTICSVRAPRQPISVSGADLSLKRVSISSEFVFSRLIHKFEIEKQGEIMEKVTQLIEQKRFFPHPNLKIFADCSLESAKEAHALQQSGAFTGKIALTAKW